MKRILMFGAVLLGVLFSAVAAGYNAKQEDLISSIEQYLRNKNYSVERRDDGLKFTDDGAVYYIEVDENDTNPMYVRLCRYVKFDDKIRRDKVIKNLNDINGKYVVKAYCKEKNVILSAEMFVTSAAQFTYAFPDMLDLMKGAYESIE